MRGIGGWGYRLERTHLDPLVRPCLCSSWPRDRLANVSPYQPFENARRRQHI